MVAKLILKNRQSSNQQSRPSSSRGLWHEMPKVVEGGRFLIGSGSHFLGFFVCMPCNATQFEQNPCLPRVGGGGESRHSRWFSSFIPFSTCDRAGEGKGREGKGREGKGGEGERGERRRGRERERERDREIER